MAEHIVVVGAGGFGREVLDVIRAINATPPEPRWKIVGVLDDSPSAENLRLLEQQGIAHLGRVAPYLDNPRMLYVVGIGSPIVRRAIVERFDAAGWHAATLVHPVATIGFGVVLGAGTIVCAGARVSTNVAVGRHSHLDVNVSVGHDTRMGDFVRLNPASSVSGDCIVGNDVLIGVGATVLNALTIGGGSTVGGSACVVRDVAPGTLVKGVPAR